MPALLSAAQIAAQNTETEREPTEAELLANFVSNIPAHPNMESQIDSPWGPMSVTQAKQREKDVFLAHRRQLLAQDKQRRQAALEAAAEAERAQQRFEEASLRGEHLRLLRQALALFNEAASVHVTLEVSLDAARSDLKRLKADTTLDAAKLGKALGSGRDLVDAWELRHVHTSEALKGFEDALREALQQARMELTFLHGKKRKELIAETRLSIESIFHVQALGRNHLWPEPLSVCARSVVELDKAAGYYAGRYGWPEMKGSPESLLGAVEEFENRISRVEGVLYL